MKKRVSLAVLITICMLAFGGCRSSSVEEVFPEPTFVRPVETPVAEQPVLPLASVEAEKESPAPVEQVAEEIPLLQVSVDGYDRTAVFTDGEVSTRYYLSSRETVTVRGSSPFSALYLIWNETPEPFRVRWEGGELVCGEEHFLHDYIRLPEPVDCIEITTQQEKLQPLCDIFAYTSGSAPQGVQEWKPPHSQADILVFPTHSDDDVLFFGPLISYYTVEREMAVQTAFMVKHYAEPERGHERLNGLWAMGVRHYPVLGTAPDTTTHSMYEAMSIYEPHGILEWQVEQIRRFKPLVVVGHDLEGEYGNGGHKVNAHFLTQAIHVAGDLTQFEESFRCYGTWETPKLYLHLYPENEWYLDVNTPMENDEKNRTPFEAAQEAFVYHESQANWGYEVQQNDAERRFDCRPFGLFYSAVGQDDEADLMDNIREDIKNAR